MRAVLGNFLGTYTSRYSDYEGYWLFGLVVDDLAELRIDLLASPDEPSSPLGFAVGLAASKFGAQVQKTRVERAHIKEAWLRIRRLPGPALGSVNGHPCSGHDLSFLAWAVMDSDLRFETERVLFVAPHDPAFELRSARAQ